MSSLPQKSIKGAVFKTWAISSIDKLIDYLSGTFIRGGKGISVRRSAGVTIIELEKQPAPVQQSVISGGTSSAPQDISATVSGNTASVELSGSTSAVEFVGTGDVTISGNTNGQIEIGVTGGTGGSVGFPNYFNPDVMQGNVQLNHSYSFLHSVWVIGDIGVEPDSQGQYNASYILLMTSGVNTERIQFDLFSTDSGSCIYNYTLPFVIPIPANVAFQLNFTNQLSAGSPRYSLGIYPCI